VSADWKIARDVILVALGCFMLIHETVIAGTYNWVSNIGLNEYADQKGIDAFANGLGVWTQNISATMRKIQNGFVRSYALSVLLGVVLILGYLLMK